MVVKVYNVYILFKVVAKEESHGHGIGWVVVVGDVVVGEWGGGMMHDAPMICADHPPAPPPHHARAHTHPGAGYFLYNYV